MSEPTTPLPKGTRVSVPSYRGDDGRLLGAIKEHCPANGGYLVVLDDDKVLGGKAGGWGYGEVEPAPVPE
jgi:hypothetical protein